MIINSVTNVYLNFAKYVMRKRSEIFFEKILRNARLVFSKIFYSEFFREIFFYLREIFKFLREMPKKIEHFHERKMFHETIFFFFRLKPYDRPIKIVKMN